MINEIRKLFCKHDWTHVDTEYYIGFTLSRTYGCMKCGSTSEVLRSEDAKWRFEQRYKGDKFTEEISND